MFEGTGSMPAALITQPASELQANTATPAPAASSQVRGRAAAANDCRRSAALAGRRQKYSRIAAEDIPRIAASLSTAAPGPSLPPSRPWAWATARQMPQATITAKLVPSSATPPATTSREKSPSRPRRGADRGDAGAGAVGSGGAGTGSDIEVGHLQRVVLDELAARFDHVAHQRAEDLGGGDGVLDPHAQQAAGIRVDRGFPQLLGGHFAQALEALDLATLLGLVHQPGLGLGEARDRLAAVAADDLGAFADQAVQQHRRVVQRAQLSALEDRQRQHLLDLLAHVAAGQAQRGRTVLDRR